jgi:hypothetical protein
MTLPAETSNQQDTSSLICRGFAAGRTASSNSNNSFEVNFNQSFTTSSSSLRIWVQSLASSIQKQQIKPYVVLQCALFANVCVGTSPLKPPSESTGVRWQFICACLSDALRATHHQHQCILQRAVKKFSLHSNGIILLTNTLKMRLSHPGSSNHRNSQGHQALFNQPRRRMTTPKQAGFQPHR